MTATSTEYFLCRISELREEAAIGREIIVGDRKIPCVIYTLNSSPQVFLNSCPHTGIRLEWRVDDFLDISARYLQCSMHGALFEPTHGLCIKGPCRGQHLVKIPTIIRDDKIYLLNVAEIPTSAR